MPRPVGRTAEWSLFSVALRPDGLPRHASGLRRPGRASTRAIYLVLRGGPVRDAASAVGCRPGCACRWRQRGGGDAGADADTARPAAPRPVRPGRGGEAFPCSRRTWSKPGWATWKCSSSTELVAAARVPVFSWTRTRRERALRPPPPARPGRNQTPRRRQPGSAPGAGHCREVTLCSQLNLVSSKRIGLVRCRR